MQMRVSELMLHMHLMSKNRGCAALVRAEPSSQMSALCRARDVWSVPCSAGYRASNHWHANAIQRQLYSVTRKVARRVVVRAKFLRRVEEL